jgi:hypothetical protein
MQNFKLKSGTVLAAHNANALEHSQITHGPDLITAGPYAATFSTCNYTDSIKVGNPVQGAGIQVLEHSVAWLMGSAWQWDGSSSSHWRHRKHPRTHNSAERRPTSKALLIQAIHQPENTGLATADSA